MSVGRSSSPLCSKHFIASKSYSKIGNVGQSGRDKVHDQDAVCAQIFHYDSIANLLEDIAANIARVAWYVTSNQSDQGIFGVEPRP